MRTRNVAAVLLFATLPLAAHAADHVAAVRQGDSLRAKVLTNAAHLRAGMHAHGCIIHGYGHVVPWVIGDETRAIAIADGLLKSGFHVQAIRPPTVPIGTARLRVSTNAGHDASDIDAFLSALRDVVRS